MISGLVVHLGLDDVLATETVDAIEAESTIELGERQDRKLPIVLECQTPNESQATTDWLISLPGVTHVDVVFVDLEPSVVSTSRQFT